MLYTPIGLYPVTIFKYYSSIYIRGNFYVL